MASEQRLKILAYKDREDAVWYHRLYIPLAHMAQKHNVKYEFVKFDDNGDYGLTYEQLDNDIFLFSRVFCDYATLKDCFNVLKEDFKVVMDLDDYWYLPTTHPAYSEWNANRIPLLTESHLRNSDYVITTNKRLYKEIKKINKNVVVIENSLHEPLFPKIKNPHDKVRVGFTGGTSHLSDVTQLGPILERLHKLYDFDVVYGGYIEGNETSEKIRNILSSGKDCVCLPNRNVMSYGEVYKDIDILVAPMSDNKFNGCKSNLKMLECSATNTKFVGNYVHPYKDDLVYGMSIENQLDMILRGRFNMDNIVTDFNIKYNLPTINNKRYEFLKSII